VEDAGNVGKLSNMSVTGGSSAYLTGTIIKYNGMLVVSYDTGNGLLQWHLYIWDEINLTFIDMTLPAHTHTTSTDGGDLNAINVAGLNAGAIFFNYIMPTIANWNRVTNSGTGSGVVDDALSRRSKLSTGSTTTGYGNIGAWGIPTDFNIALRWNGGWNLVTAITNILFRWGAGTENVNDASNNNSKIGLEWCDSQATSKYYALSANGTSRSLQDTNVSLAINVDHGCRIVYYPASKAEYTFWDATVYNKTTILPVGNNLSDANVSWGIKNNNGGAVNRDLFVYGTYLANQDSSTVWVDG